MSLNKLILNIALKIVDILTFWVKKDKKRITFVSLTQSHLASDFKLIDDLLKKENKYHIHYNLIEFEKNLLGDFKYFLNCFKSLLYDCNVFSDNFLSFSKKSKNCLNCLSIFFSPTSIFLNLHKLTIYVISNYLKKVNTFFDIFKNILLFYIKYLLK